MKKDKVYDAMTGKIIKATIGFTRRILVGIPLTGLVRVEWMTARYGQVIPCNWSQVEAMHIFDSYSPLGFQVADARNIIANAAVKEKFSWCWFIDHDVILPPTTILRWNERIRKADIPIFGGLYFTKSVPAEPLVYRGRGNSYFDDWKMGNDIWVDGMGLGNNMIHVSILKAMWKDSEEYMLGEHKVRRIFETPAKVGWDPENRAWVNSVGTEDLPWYSRIIEGDYLRKAGWPKIAKRKYPFLVDTKVFCSHIDFNGIQYPSRGEEQEFVRKK